VAKASYQNTISADGGGTAANRLGYLPVDEFIRRNADPIWLNQNEIWEYTEFPDECERFPGGSPPGSDFSVG
jgi:hypothetical protein